MIVGQTQPLWRLAAVVHGDIAKEKPMSTTFESVRKLVAKEISVDEEKVTLDSSLTNDFAVDSLTMVEIAMSLETEFGIEIDDDTAASLGTVRQIVEYLDSRLGVAV